MSEQRSLIVRYDEGPLALVILNRPERRNALSRDLVDQLSGALSKAAAESSVRVIVLSGEGPVFCAGMDLKEASASNNTAEAEQQAVSDAQALADLMAQIHEIPKPVIAALNGDAYAGGAGLMTACDFVVASSDAKIGYPEVRRGLVAAMVMHDLVRQAGERRARELLVTGAPIDAETAERWGLVNRVVAREACLATALELGRSLVGCAPRAVETTKRLLDEAAGRHVLRGAAAVTAAVRVSEEAQEGMNAFFEKRSPRWAEGV